MLQAQNPLQSHPSSIAFTQTGDASPVRANWSAVSLGSIRRNVHDCCDLHNAAISCVVDCNT